MKSFPEQAEEHAAQLGERGARWLRSKHATWILAVISFVESVFAPILIDPFLIALILARRDRWVLYITISVIFSVLGGMAGYLLGYLFFESVGSWLVEWAGVTETFEWLVSSLRDSAFAFVLLGAVTPIPYKVVALASGFVEISFWAFLSASLFGRIIRLALVGYAAYAVGPHALPIIRKHLLTLAYVFLAILVAYILWQVW